MRLKRTDCCYTLQHNMDVSQSSREVSMKRCLAIVSAIALVVCAAPLFAQQKATIQNVPEIPYTSVPNLLKVPAGETLGEAVGIATNSKGHIFVFFRKIGRASCRERV